MRLLSSFLLGVSLLLICFPYLSNADVSEECFNNLWVMEAELRSFAEIPDPTKLSNHTKSFLTLSGRFINDFGEYDVCQNSTDSHYLSLLFTGNISNQTFSAVMGFCGPSSCSSDDCLGSIPQISDLYRQGMALPLQNITNLSTISFYDPRATTEKSASTLIVIIGLVSVAMMTVVATGAGIYKEFKDDLFPRKGAKERLLPENEASDDNGDRSSRPSVSGAPRPGAQLRGIWKFLDAFDARKNFDKIIKIKYTDTYDANLEIFNGIRVLMMLYVVFGHTFLFGTFYIDNLVDLVDFGNSWWLLVINSALFSVDVFFYMSGFLFAYIGLGKLKKMRPGLINFFILAVHRLLRFWPTYVVAILFFWKVLPLLGEGPIWFQTTYYTGLCDESSWQNFLLVDDLLVKSANYCFGWGWYLSNDYQMFLMTPIFIWLYIRHKKLGKLLMFVLICVSWFMAIVIGARLGVRATPPKSGGVTNGQGFSEYYVKPYIRLPPYFIGVLVALWYKEFREQYGWSYKFGKAVARNKFLRNFFPLLGYAMLLVLTFLPRQVQENDQAWPDWLHVTWRAFQKSAYVLGLTFIMLPILVGRNTLFKRFMSHPLWVPLARVSFCAYLVHLFWIYRNYYDSTFSFHLTYQNGTINTISNGATAFFYGLILSLLVEIPIANMEGIFIPKGKGSKPRNNRLKPTAPPAEDRTRLDMSDNSIIPIVNKQE